MKDLSYSSQIYSPVAWDKFGVLLIPTARDAILGPFYDLQGLLVFFSTTAWLSLSSSLQDARCYLPELIFDIEKVGTLIFRV